MVDSESSRLGQAYARANGSDHAPGIHGPGPEGYDERNRRPMDTNNPLPRRDRRAGGYGGAYAAPNGSSPSQSGYQQALDGSETGPIDENQYNRFDRANREWPDQGQSRTYNGRNGTMGYGHDEGTQQIQASSCPYQVTAAHDMLSHAVLTADEYLLQDVLGYIRKEWTIMTEEDCIPVQVALQLMDSSSLGRAHQSDQFKMVYKQLQEALKAIVNEHHQGFNSSMGAFHRVQSGIQNSQTRIRILRDTMTLAKSDLTTTKPELKGLAASSQEYDDMLQILSQIEQLQSIPENLEARISEKKFLTAVDILQEALRIIRTSDVGALGALADLTVYVSNQETSLIDILVEELHSHLYLKSPYCHDRWKHSAFDFGQRTKVSKDEAPAALPTVKPIYQFLEKLDLTSPMVEDVSRNPEADNFYYIQLLLESLNKLGQLGLAVESVVQRMPTELFRLVERTNAEVEQRYRNAVHLNPKSEKGKGYLDLQEDGLQEKILSELLYTLYSKFGAVAEGHRVVHDVITGILKRENVVDSAPLTGGFRELWKLYQNEIRTILHDYLATDGHNALRSTRSQGKGGTVFKRSQRDKSKKIFTFSNINTTSSELVTAHEDLEAILKVSVPGLVSESRRPLGVTGNDSNLHQDGSATGHKLLVEPSVFNMGYLLPPSLSFIQRLKEIVPDRAGVDITSLTSFLDDFLVNVFHPQLDEALTDLSAHIFIELDAFQQDPRSADIAKKPVFKGTSAFLSLITTFCKMLDTIPRDQAITHLIITQMLTYFDKCRGHYKSLVTRPPSQTETGICLKAAAALSESDDLREVAMKSWAADIDGQQQQVLERETELLIAHTHESPLEPYSIISDRKSITSLCLLYTSMRWLASKVSRLRRLVDDPINSTKQNEKARKMQWILPSPRQSTVDSASIYLPLTPGIVAAFDEVVYSYEDLATSVLLALHMEIRSNIILRITTFLRSNHLLEQHVNEPDPNILGLNADLVSFDEDVTTFLRPQEHRFIFTGLGHLVDTLLVANAGQIGAMNLHGCARVQLNTLVLQQNFKNIEYDVLLTRSARFFELFVAGPDAIVARAKEAGSEGLEFSYGELKILIELCYSEALASDRREVAMQAKRTMNDHLLQLSEHTWQTG